MEAVHDLDAGTCSTSTAHICPRLGCRSRVREIVVFWTAVDGTASTGAFDATHVSAPAPSRALRKMRRLRYQDARRRLPLKKATSDARAAAHGAARRACGARLLKLMSVSLAAKRIRQ